METHPNLDCNWRLRYRKNLTDRHFRLHLAKMEEEVHRLNIALRSRDEALASLKSIGERLERVGEDLSGMFREFSRARATLLCLTNMEQRVYDCVKSERGISCQEISDRLNISIRASKFHLSNIYIKAGVYGKNEL
jgi:DNA-binding CsgD family transcriptional regulator